MSRSALIRLGIAAGAAACFVVGVVPPASAAAGIAPVAAYQVPQLVGSPGADAIEDSYIVVYKDSVDADPASVAALTSHLAATHQATVTHNYATALRGFAATMDASRAASLSTDPAVAYVVADQRGFAYGTQTNPPSWGLDRADQRDRPLDNRYTYQNTASNVHAYIVDSGIRVTHQDFGGRAQWNLNTIDSNNTDCLGHGTHVAGTVGGTQFGIAKGVKLHAIKVLDCAGNTTVSAVLAAVDWVTANAIKPAVVNMSLGFALSGSTDPLLNAITASMNTGITYVVAAGNSNTIACNFAPAILGGAGAIGVGATTSTDARASFSNWGGCVDMYAPGQGIRSAAHTNNFDSILDNGTSMAAPHVAGAAALYLSGHPTASTKEVHDAVVFNASVDRITGLPNCGCGSAGVSHNRLLYSLINPPLAGTNKLLRGQWLLAGQSIRANLGNHTLVMQSDGNLVHYQGSKALWASGTGGHPNAYANMQTDGNFVIYTSGNVPLWATNTAGTPANQLIMQDDANIVLYGSVAGRPPQPFWSSR